MYPFEHMQPEGVKQTHRCRFSRRLVFTDLKDSEIRTFFQEKIKHDRSYFSEFSVCIWLSDFQNDHFSCHRTHEKPGITKTLLAMNMYSNFEMQFGLDDEFDYGPNRMLI